MSDQQSNDEFQELIRSFSLDKQQEPPRRPAPPPSAGYRGGQPAGAAGQRAPAARPPRHQCGARPAAGAPPQRTFSPQSPGGGAPRQPLGYPPARPGATPGAGAGGGTRPAGGMQPQFRSPPARPAGTAGAAPRGFDAAGFEAPGARTQPGPLHTPGTSPMPGAGPASGARGQADIPRAPAPQRPMGQPLPTTGTAVKSPRSFQLHIDSQEYREIPDNVPRARGAGGRGASPCGPGAAGRPPAGPLPPSGGGQKPPRPPKKKKKRGPGRFSRIMMALLIAGGAVCFAVFLSIFALQSASDMLGMNKEDVKAEITIAEGATVEGVARQLQEAGVIEQPFTFEIYAKIKDKTEYQPGTYSLNSKMAYDQIMDKMTKGSTQKEMVWITFPEGQTIVQIAQKLEENEVCTAQEFLDAADSGSFGFTFEGQIPDNPLRFHKLEGYIFPDTYQFYVGEMAESVVGRFLEVFNKRVTADLYEVMEKNNMTLDQTITLASIIQKETGDPQYMGNVSSVFHNRLNQPQTFPRLESDATIDYVEKQIKPNIAAPNQAMYDAYNTYVCEGLPVGPINNPGMDAIKAALAPEQTTYYYFLSDRVGEYFFSSTIAEHNAYLANAQDAHGTTIDHSGDEAGQ